MRPWEGSHYRGLLGGEVNNKECRVYMEFRVHRFTELQREVNS